MRKILNLMVRPDFKSKIKIQTFVYLLDFLSHLKRKNSFEEEKIHEKCQEELRVLRDELVRYKSRTNQLMKAKYNKKYECKLISLSLSLFLTIFLLYLAIKPRDSTTKTNESYELNNERKYNHHQHHHNRNYY